MAEINFLARVETVEPLRSGDDSAGTKHHTSVTVKSLRHGKNHTVKDHDADRFQPHKGQVVLASMASDPEAGTEEIVINLLDPDEAIGLLKIEGDKVLVSTVEKGWRELDPMEDGKLNGITFVPTHCHLSPPDPDIIPDPPGRGVETQT